jgi:hypothetical protein
MPVRIMTEPPIVVRTVSYVSQFIAIVIRQEEIDRAVKIAEAFGAKRLILFGSAATEPEQAKYIDLACDGVAGCNLFEIEARLVQEGKIKENFVSLWSSKQDGF